FHFMYFAGAPDGQPEPFRERVYARHPHTVQTTRYLVGVVVELTPSVQLRHDDFCSTALVFVILVDVGRNAPAVVADGNTVVRVNGDDDVIAIRSEERRVGKECRCRRRGAMDDSNE